MDTPTEWSFLLYTDFAGKLTPARGVPDRLSTPDEIALWHLANRTLMVDTDAGVVCRADGVTRAERVVPETGYGNVYLGYVAGKLRWARAHRVVWIAAHGPIPGMYQIVQRNGLRWDNRISNLDIVTHAEAIKHAKWSPADLATMATSGDDDRPTIRPHVVSTDVLVPERATRRNIA